MRQVILLVFLMLIVSCASLSTKNEHTFSIDTANAILLKINVKMAHESTEYHNLSHSVDTINKLQVAAKNYLIQKRQHLANIKQILDNAEIVDVLKQDTAKYQYLEQEKERTLSEIVAVEFFNYQAEDLLLNIRAVMKQHIGSALLQKAPTFLEINYAKLFENTNYSFNTFDQFSLIQVKPGLLLFGAVFVMLISGFVTAIICRVSCYNAVTNARRVLLKNAICKIIRRYAWLVIALMFLGLYGLLVYSSLELYLSFPFLILTVAAYFAAIAALHIYIVVLSDSYSWFRDKFAAQLKIRLLVVFTVSVIGVCIHFLIQGQEINYMLEALGRAIYATLISFAFVWFSWLLFRLPKFQEDSMQDAARLAKIALGTFGALIIFLAGNGYVYFAIFIIPKLLLTVLMGVVIVRLTQYLKIACRLLHSPDSTISKKLHEFLGLDPKRKLVEFVVLFSVIYAQLMLFCMFILFKSWEMSDYYFLWLKSLMFEGFRVFDFLVVPVSIFRGIEAFCIIMILGRGLATYVSKLNAFAGEGHRQTTVSVLITYSAFCIGILIALITAGVYLKNIGVIIGALSVGIGFGLQHIVGDFIGGLVLLIQKPIRFGDLVLIDGMEGHVKQINMLTTRIKTLEEVDVLVPNSNLITKSVVNYTLRSTLSQLENTFTLEKASDMNRAKQLLVDIVSSYPGVVNTPPHAPIVLLQFIVPKDATLYVLHLRYCIDDIEKKDETLSAINFNVSQAFQEHGISMK